MTSLAKIFIGITVILILIAAGFGVGSTFKKKQNAVLPEGISSPSQNTVKAPAPTIEPNQTIFTVSPPSRGRVNFSIPLAFENLSGTNGTVFLSRDQARDITTKDNILLFDSDGAVMDGIGKITEIKDSLTNQTAISFQVMNLPEKSPMPTRGEIVTHAIAQANRLPLAALIKDDTGYVVWEAVRDLSGSVKATRRPVTGVHIINDAFFVMDTPDYVSNVYILNPDSSLTDGQYITVNQTLYSPGYIANDETLAAAPKRIYPDRTLEEKILKEAETSASSACSTSCGENTASQFIERVKSLALPKAEGAAP